MIQMHTESRRSPVDWASDHGEEWRNEAACLGVDPEAMFPDAGGSTEPGKTACLRCPVRRECLEDGLHEHFGIRGGLSERERRRLNASGWKPGDPLPVVKLREVRRGHCFACNRTFTDLEVHFEKFHQRGRAA